MALSKLPGAEEEGDGVFAEINITPLTDIFLVLLIIFMVTSSVIIRQSTDPGGAKAGLKVNLPKGGAADVKPAATDLSVAILSDGRIVVAGDVVDLAEVEESFKAAKAKNPDTMVIVQADEGVPHGKVVQVMELAKGAGLAQLAIGIREAAK